MTPIVKLETKIPPHNIFLISAAILPFRGLSYDEVVATLTAKNFTLEREWYQVKHGSFFASELTNVMFKVFTSNGAVNIELRGNCRDTLDSEVGDISTQRQIDLLENAIETMFGQTILSLNR